MPSQRRKRSDDSPIVQTASTPISSDEKTLAKGRNAINSIVNSLHISCGDATINRAHSFYKIAIDRQFISTGGRRLTSYTAAVCLYIALRRDDSPHLLFDFSNHLNVSVYILGGVFVQLSRLLGLESRPFIESAVDPSLFIHRFSERLLGRRDTEISCTALRIIAGISQDWIQTRRKPSSLWAPALYIAALAHNHGCSKSEAIRAVNIGEAKKRLTAEEFILMAGEVRSQLPIPSPADLEYLLCRHKDSGEPQFAHGLCRECYDVLFDISDSEEPKSAETPIPRDVVDEMPERISDIEEDEVDKYLHDEEGKQYRRIIWEAMNREYLEEQVTKEAKPRKQRSVKVPNNPTGEMLNQKKFTSRVNYDVLSSLNADEKRQGVESDTGVFDGEHGNLEANSNAFDSEAAIDCDEADTFDDGNDAEDNCDDYYGDEDGEYGYEDDCEYGM